MRITLITALDPFEETAGAERTLTRWLGYLSELGYDIDVITYGTQTENNTSFVDNLIRLDDKAPISMIERYLRDDSTDVVLTQGGWSDIALWATEEHDVPCILCVMSNFELQLQSGISADVEPTHIISVSDEFRARANGVYKWTPATTVYQPIDFEYYTVKDHEPERYTIINPVSSKGGAVFRSLAEQRPDDAFLAKMGWNHQRNDDLSFDLDIYDIFSRSLDFHVTPPREPDLDSLNNVEFVRRGDIREIYRQTKVLLVPSQWEEAFGRVVIEAMHNGIPVVASDVGGLSEACGGAGLLVEENNSVDAWSATLDELRDDVMYEEYASRGRQRALRYRENMNDELEKFADVIRSVTQEN